MLNPSVSLHFVTEIESVVLTNITNFQYNIVVFLPGAGEGVGMTPPVGFGVGAGHSGFLQHGFCGSYTSWQDTGRLGKLGQLVE